ncbi:MAG: hypothetical protein ACFFG0_02370 [Candidatus Thorarchaeota archaeon]
MSEEKMIFQVPAAISNIKTMSQFLRVSVDTQETLSAEEYKRLFLLHNKVGWFTFNASPIEVDDIKNLTPVRSGIKSPSKRLRDAIYQLWKQNNKNMDFDPYYEWYMEYLISAALGELG